MNISTVSSDSTITELSNLSLSQISTRKPPPPPEGASELSGTDTADVSKGAELMSNLEELQSSDPEAFTDLVSSFAEKLKEAAAETDDEEEKARLEDMASKFQSVADGDADISTLAPPEPPSAEDTQGVGAYSQEQNNAAGQMQPGGMSSAVQDLFDTFFSDVESALANI
jgi:hypothetical protein